MSKIRGVFITALIGFALLAGCGSSSSDGTTEYNSGSPPRPSNEQELVQKLVGRRNDISGVACIRGKREGNLDLWSCRLAPSGPASAEAEIELVVTNFGEEYGISDCRSIGPEVSAASEKPRCSRIH